MWKSVLPFVAAGQWTKMEPDVTVHDPAVSSWIKGEQPPADHPVSLSVVVRIDDDRHAALEQTFWEVSDPKHANYGKYLSRDEVTEMLAVPQDRLERIQEYLAAHDCTEINVAANQDVVSVACPASAIETALNTKLHFFTHQEHSDIQIVRASQHYHLPEHMTRDVVMVGELLQFPLLKPDGLSGLQGGKGQWPDTCASSTCSGLVTPAVLSARYRHPNATGSEQPVAGNSMAVAEFQGQTYKTADLDTFSTSCSVPQGVDDNVGAGHNDNKGSGVEAVLDIEYIKAAKTTNQSTKTITRRFYVGVISSLLPLSPSYNARADLAADLLAKSTANKELNDKKRMATSYANFARSRTVADKTCRFPENFFGCQNAAELGNVRFLSDDIKIECKGKEGSCASKSKGTLPSFMGV